MKYFSNDTQYNYFVDVFLVEFLILRVSEFFFSFAKGVISQRFKLLVFLESKEFRYDIKTLQLDASDN